MCPDSSTKHSRDDVVQQLQQEISQLRESIYHYQLISENIPEIFWIHDMEQNKTVYVSPTVETIWRQSQEEWLESNISWSEKVHPEDRERIQAKYEAFKRGECDYDEEYRLLHDDGTLLWIRDRAVMHTKKEPNRTLVLGMSQDITLHKKTVLSHQKAELRLKTHFSQSSFPMMIFNNKGLLLEVNAAWETFWQVDRREVIGKYNVFHDCQLQQLPFGKEIREVFNGKVLKFPEFFYIPSDSNFPGVERWITGQAYPVTDPDGTIQEAVVIMIDVSERIKMEQALRESEQKFATIFHASPDTVVINELETGKFLEVNEQYCNISGFTREETIGRTSIELGHWQKPEDRKKYIQELKKNGFVKNMELTLFGKNEKPIPILISSRIISLGDTQCILQNIHDITSLKEAEDALRESEEKFYTVFHSSPISILVTRLSDGIIIDANELFLKTGGYKRSDIIGKSSVAVGNWYNPADRDAFVETLRETGTFYTKDIVFQGSQGQRIPVILSSRLIRIQGEECVLSIGLDISDRKKAEETIRKSEERIRTILEGSGIGVALCDVSGTLNFANQSFCELLGYNAEELRTINFSTIFHDSAFKNLIHSKRNISSDTPVMEETCIIHKDGSVIPVEISTTHFEEDGQEFISVFVNDITQRKEAEKAVFESEEMYRTLVNASPDGIAIVSLAGEIQYISDQTKKMYRVPDDYDYTKRNIFEYIHPDDIPQAKKNFEGYLKGDHEPQPGCYRQLRVDGTIFHGEVSLAPLVDASGDRKTFLCINRDVTDRIRQEEEQQKIEDKLKETQKLESLGILAEGSHMTLTTCWWESLGMPISLRWNCLRILPYGVISTRLPIQRCGLQSSASRCSHTPVAGNSR